MAHSANQTKISFSAQGTTFTEIPFLMEIPELGAALEKVDVTTLADRTKRYIPGTQDYGDLVFKFLYDNQSINSNFQVLTHMANERRITFFRIEYPDGTTHEFQAIPSVKLDAGSLNGALTFSVTMLLQSDIRMLPRFGS